MREHVEDCFEYVTGEYNNGGKILTKRNKALNSTLNVCLSLFLNGGARRLRPLFKLC